MQHTWLTNLDVHWSDEGDFDADHPSEFARSASDPHNGPECKVCRFNFCVHCHPLGWQDDNCTFDAKPLPDGPAMSDSEFEFMAGIGRVLRDGGFQ